MDRRLVCEETRSTLSPSRLGKYMLPGETDEFNAVARHLWNMALCESLYPALQTFEILLRNAICDSVSHSLGANWIESQRNFRLPEWNRVLKAKDELRRQNKQVDPGRLVAELTLGFWTGLFASEYDRTIAIPVMRRGLRRFPDSLRTRRILYDKFERIRHLRNRVSHYEPIWHWNDLPVRHDEIIAYIGYISPVQEKVVGLIDRFPAIHTADWKYYRARIGNEILTPTSPQV